jgi:hypothetical protein
MSKNQITVRTKEELIAIVSNYVDTTKMSLRRISAYALGDASKLPRYVNNAHVDLKFMQVNNLLTFIENNPGGPK